MARHNIGRSSLQGGNPILVLTRKRDECIRIGHDIVVTVIDIRGDKIRLGVSAPSEVSVHRQEIYEAIQREGRRTDGLGTEGQPR